MIINPYRFSSGGGGGSTLLDGLLHWWDLDESSGNAIDATGNQDLTDNNTVGANATGAPDGGGSRVFVPANSEYFSASAGAIWNSGTATTIAGWLKVDSANAATTHWFGHDAPNGYSRLFFDSNGKPSLWFDGGLSARDLSTDLEGAWHCLVATSTGPGGSDELFVDGVSVDTGAAGWEPGSAAFHLGASHTALQHFYGEMCSNAIWNRVLTSAEIAEFYNSGVNLRYADL